MEAMQNHFLSPKIYLNLYLLLYFLFICFCVCILIFICIYIHVTGVLLHEVCSVESAGKTSCSLFGYSATSLTKLDARSQFSGWPANKQKQPLSCPMHS